MNPSSIYHVAFFPPIRSSGENTLAEDHRHCIVRKNLSHTNLPPQTKHLLQPITHLCYLQSTYKPSLKMPLKDLLGSSRDQPYAASDPRNPKTYYKVIHCKRKANEAAQGRRMSEAYAAGKLKAVLLPASLGAEEGGVARHSVVEAEACERKIPGVVSHNDTLHFATVSGWTHTDAGGRARRMKRRGCGGRGMVRRCRPKMELGIGIHLEMARA